MFPIITN